MLFGAHVSAAGGISTAIERAVELRCDAVQVFTQSPRMWKPTAHTDEELERFRALRAASSIRYVACHALYLVNLATPDREMRRKSITALRASLETAAAIDADSVVFHVGSHLGRGLKDSLRRVVPALESLLDLTSERLWLLLENSAGAGDTIGRSTDELGEIVDRLERHPRLGVCLDSCHWWVSGVDVTSADALDEALERLDEHVGLDRLRCLHVNDAAVGRGSNRDRHTPLEVGTIGRGMGTFLAHPAFQELPAILETPGPDGGYAGELALMRKLRANGRRRRPPRWG